MASLSQLRWPAPAAISSPGGQAIAADQSRKDPWMLLPSPRTSTPAKRPPNSPWDEMGLKRPLFGMVASPGSDIWANDSSPLFGSVSPCPSVTSAFDSPKLALSPKPFVLPEVSSLTKSVLKVSAPLHDFIVDTKDDPLPVKQKSPSSLPFADRGMKTFSDPDVASQTSIASRRESRSPAVSVAKPIAEKGSRSDCSYPTNDLWANDQNDSSSCDDSYFCVDSDEQLLKTELCRNWGPPLYHCQYGDTCNFAHGEAELRERIRRGEYKSKLCDEPVRLGVRSCTYTTQQQSRCNYCHPGEAVRRKCSRPYFDSEYFAILAKEFPGNNYPFGIFI